MSIALRPLLRTSSPTITITITSTTTAINPSIPPSSLQQTRHANILRRPKRPFLLPQLILLSDGSAYTQLTTSPRGIIRSTKDVRNHPLWNPTLHQLMDVEEDEAGKLRAFRERFGRGWDNREMAEKERGEREREKREVTGVEGGVEAKKGREDGGFETEDGKGKEAARVGEVEEGGLVDLISEGYELAMANRGGKKKKPGAVAAAAAAAAAAAVEAAAKPAAKPAAAAAGAGKKKK